MDSIKILISCHKETDYIETDILRPIQLGCDNVSLRLSGMLRDNEGDNISRLNPMYCELTAQYWAWKNLDAEYYGFCHYRRYFNFSENKYPEDVYGNVIAPCFLSDTSKLYGLDDDTISSLVTGYDVITTNRRDVRKIPDYPHSVYEQYKQAPYLHIEDLDTVLNIIDEKYPDYSKDAHDYIDGHIALFCNMYILRKEIFFDYCSWMFDILEEFCKRRDMSGYDKEALRTPGHLSERLFGIYYNHLIKTHPEYKTKELQSVYFESTEPATPLAPAFSDGGVPIVFAANDKFVPVFASCFQSLINHASTQNNYDVVLLHSDITDKNKVKLLSMIKDARNISLRFFNVRPLIYNYNLKANEHISVETYYRFLIQEVLPDYDKVLYIDCDLIICDDVAKLYCEDVSGYMLAATRDVGFLGQINGQDDKAMEYVKSELPLKNPFDYFQAGVLLFNEAEMKAAHSLDEWLTFASHPYMYNDQDVLNLYCEGHVKFFDMRWNVITDCNNERIEKIISVAPEEFRDEYFNARKDPKIVHYAGSDKPWNNPLCDFGRLFWDVARTTPFFKELVMMLDLKLYEERFPSIKKRIIKAAGHAAAIIFPRGSKRRDFINRIIKRG